MYRVFVKMHLAHANRARRAFSYVFQHLLCDRAGDRQFGDPERALRVHGLSARRPQTCENLTLRGIEAAQADIDDRRKRWADRQGAIIRLSIRTDYCILGLRLAF